VSSSASLLWVKRVGFVMSAICPVHPEQQTFPDPVALRICARSEHRERWHPLLGAALNA